MPPTPTKARKTLLTTRLMAEVVSYGGLPVTRATAHALSLADTGSKVAADLFAFGPRVRLLPGATAMGMDEVAAIRGAA